MIPSNVLPLTNILVSSLPQNCPGPPTFLRLPKKLDDLFVFSIVTSISHAPLQPFLLTIVRPVLEYSSIIWDPSFTYSSLLESVQYFALKLVSKSWSSSYPSLLSALNVNRLSFRRQQSKLITLFKLKHNLLFVPNPPITPLVSSHTYCLRSSSSNNLHPLHANLSLFQNSFFPSPIKTWNSLPPEAKSTLSLSEFKFLINRFLCSRCSFITILITFVFLFNPMQLLFYLLFVCYICCTFAFPFTLAFAIGIIL